jgi:predicted AAA+ superfamily ATPase
MLTRALNLNNILKKNTSALLLGSRGVGKTKLAQSYQITEKHFLYINLLSTDEYLSYLESPALLRKEVEQFFIENKKVNKLLVTIDEVQKVPLLLDEVHLLIEKYKFKIRFLLTGSSARKLKRSGANLLAGRVVNLKLHPLTSTEVEVDLNKALTIGTLPAIYLEPENRLPRLRAYYETYLKEEILQESLVRRLDGYHRFIEQAAQLNSKPVNFTKVAKASGVSTKTAQEYYSILEDTLLVHRLNGWSRSIRKQIQQGPKYYFFDCGVLNAILGELNLELKASSYRYGKLFETWVINELIRLNDYFDLNYRFHYWRTNTGIEVDCILTKGPNSVPIAIEIKSDTRPTAADVRSLQSFKADNKNAELFCLCRTPRSFNDEGIQFLPWQSGILQILGQSKKAKTKIA